MKTIHKKRSTIKTSWFVVDVSGKPLGRMASRIALVLQGKHRPTYTPNMDCGDFVVVVNAEKVGLTGNKLRDKVYRYHTRYYGGLRTVPAAQLLSRKPELVVKLAVQRMMPKGTMGRKMLKKLHIYRGTEHPHAAQKTVPLTF